MYRKINCVNNKKYMVALSERKCYHISKIINKKIGGDKNEKIK